MELTYLQQQSDSPPAVPLTRHRDRIGWLALPLPGLIVSFGLSLACYWQTGVSLGLFLGPLILTTFYAPFLMLAESHHRARLAVLASMAIGATIVWLLVCASSPIINSQQVFAAAFVLVAWLMLLLSASVILHQCRIPASLACTVTVVVSFLWLSWPIWLSPLLASHQRAVGWLCWPHPIMAMNGAVRHLGLWGSPMGGSDFTYRYLTSLNQDVAYPSSQSIWPCVLLHGLIGMTVLSVGIVSDRVRAYATSTVNAAA